MTWQTVLLRALSFALLSVMLHNSGYLAAADSFEFFLEWLSYDLYVYLDFCEIP